MHCSSAACQAALNSYDIEPMPFSHMAPGRTIQSWTDAPQSVLNPFPMQRDQRFQVIQPNRYRTGGYPSTPTTTGMIREGFVSNPAAAAPASSDYSIGRVHTALGIADNSQDRFLSDLHLTRMAGGLPASYSG